MARSTKASVEQPAEAKDVNNPISLAALMSKKSTFQRFMLWIVGDTPLITHAWSEKARREMLAKQVKAVQAGKEPRDPKADFLNALYEMGDGTYGFPAMAFKNALVSAAHKDKGVPKTEVMAALWISAEIVRQRPGLAGAICDMPLIRIYGSKPQMREDMARVGSGAKKTATLIYRPQFTTWAAKINGRYNDKVLNLEQLTFLIKDAGMAAGLCEYRNEKKGMFGAFHGANLEEEKAWNAFASGKGQLPEQLEEAA